MNTTNTRLQISKYIPIVNAAMLLVLLFVPPRDGFELNITYFGISKLGDDSLAMIILILLSLYTFIKTDSNQTFFNQISILIFASSITLIYFFADVSQMNPVYVFGLLLVFIFFIINIYLQGFRLKNIKRSSNKTLQISGSINLFLALLLVAFWALPFEKVTLEMFGGGTWKNSGESVQVSECCGLADFGTYNLISELLMYSLLVALLILQISGFSLPVFAMITSLFAAFLSIIRGLASIGSGPFKPTDNSAWTQELLDKFRPTETVSPTLAFYLFAFTTALIVLNISISYILSTTNSKSV